MINVLGVKVENDLKKEEVLNQFLQFLNSNKQHYVVTPNPEIILEATKDRELFQILNQADLSLADGFGLKLAGLLVAKKLRRVSGSDILPDLLNLAEKNNKKVLIINRKSGLSSASDIELFLKNNYSNLKFLIKDVDHRDNKFSFLDESRDELLDFSADILICSFGAPYQEKLVFHSLEKLSTVKLALGLGGSFDFLTKKVKRAPKIMRSLGLEWLWRLIKQPTKKWQRCKRVFRAVFVFPYKLIIWKIKN